MASDQTTQATTLFQLVCGTNGIYESIYHGVPIIGIPLLFDQFENALRLEVRGAAKVVDAGQITSQSFVETVQEVLHNPSYRSNMKRLSALHRDTPVPPLETALFWIEYVIRHKGASHLRTESFKMPWYSYHSVDVFCFLIAMLLTLTAFLVGLIRYLCLRMCSKRKSKQEQSSTTCSLNFADFVHSRPKLGLAASPVQYQKFLVLLFYFCD